MSRQPPSIGELLKQATRATRRPIAFVLAGHNGSGKSTLWYERLVHTVRIPLVNADRLTLSILPEADAATRAPCHVGPRTSATRTRAGRCCRRRVCACSAN